MCLCPLESSWALVAGISVPFSNTGSERLARKLERVDVIADTFTLNRGTKLCKPLVQSLGEGPSERVLKLLRYQRQRDHCRKRHRGRFPISGDRRPRLIQRNQ